MNMKIDAPRAWLHPKSGGFWYEATQDCEVVRIVRESDWRKIMAVVRAADKLVPEVPYDFLKTYAHDKPTMSYAVVALRNHLEKRK